MLSKSKQPRFEDENNYEDQIKLKLFFSVNSKNIDTPEGFIIPFSPLMLARLFLLKELPKPSPFPIVK